MENITIQTGWENDNFIMNKVTMKCSNGKAVVLCTFPDSHPIINKDLYYRVMILKMVRASVRLFSETGSDRRAIRVSYDALWHGIPQ